MTDLRSFKEERIRAFDEGYTTAVIDMKTANAANGARKRDGPKKAALKVLAFATGIASQVFMGFVFYNEYFLRHGVTYIEPNLAICGAEFVTIAAGIAAMAWLVWRDMGQ